MTGKKNWIARYVERTPDEHAALRADAKKRYANLTNKPRDWIADIRKTRPGAGESGAPPLPDGPRTGRRDCPDLGRSERPYCA